MEGEIEREPLSKKEPGLDNLGNFQPVQTTEDIKSSRFIVRMVYSGQKAKAVAGPLFANPLEGWKSQGQRLEDAMLLSLKKGPWAVECRWLLEAGRG